jgi:hypothetical protein
MAPFGLGVSGAGVACGAGFLTLCCDIEALFSFVSEQAEDASLFWIVFR